MAYSPEDAEEFSEVSETGEVLDAETEEHEEEDEFGSEFSDDDGFEDDAKAGHGDDY